MAAILANIKLGDEVIMPSYTFVSTANAFILRGGVPVFVDIRPDTLNIDEKIIEKAITCKTKAIVPVHYAGVGCEMDTILKIASKYRLLVIEDAAHGLKATYKGRELGTIGDFGALSFHETKNIISGEGGALLVNNPKFIKRAEVVWQKGTDRTRFMRGEVDKYTWRDVGSSFLPGEIMAAFLWAQLKASHEITKKRLRIWNNYHSQLKNLADKKIVTCPKIPKNCKHNAHIYYLRSKTIKDRNTLIKNLKKKNILCLFHYIPLHKTRSKNLFFKKPLQKLKVTNTVANCILRLPLYIGLKKANQTKVINSIKTFYKINNV